MTIVNPATSDTVSISAIDEGKTFIVASYYNRYGSGRADYAAVTTYLSNSTTIAAEQYLNSSYPANSHIRAQAITFASVDVGTVQRGEQSWASGDSSKNETLSTPVDLDYAIANIPNTYPFQKTNYSGGSYLGFFETEITSTTNLNVNRNTYTGATSIVAWEAVEFTPPPPPPLPPETVNFSGGIKMGNVIIK